MKKTACGMSEVEVDQEKILRYARGAKKETVAGGHAGILQDTED